MDGDYSSFVSIVSGAFIAFCLYLIQRLNNRLDNLQRDIGDVRVAIAKTEQENVELHTHIRRIDKNLDDLFQKVEELLLTVKNGQH